MARPISVIQNQIITNLNSNLPQLNSPSQVAVYNLFAYVVAVAINVLEQLNDIFTAEINTTVASAPPGTAQWWQKMMLAFQYDDNNLQIVQMVNYAPQYQVIIPADQIIKQCSVSSYSNRSITIKVANATAPPYSLFTTDQLNAMNAYIDIINFAGIDPTLLNALPDYLTCNTTIYYNGQYTTVINATVPAAINTYLANLSFNGNIVVSDLMETIKGVPGVEDVVFTSIALRQNTQLFSDATYLVQNNQTLLRELGTYSGIGIYDTINSTINYLIQD